MELRSVDYTELYVGDAGLSAYFLNNAFGFRTVAQASPESGLKNRRSFLLKQGSTRILVTSALTPEDPVAEYVRLHGDGIKDIAFSTPDAKGAFQEALRRGAQPVMEPVVYEGAEGRVVKATVTGPVGDVVHSFIQRETQSGTFIPGLYQPVDDGTPAGGELFTALDHIALCLRPGTLKATVAFFETVFGLKETHEENVLTEYSGMNSKVVQNANGRICFPMMEPILNKRRGQIDDFLDNHGGPGVQHLALLTHDITRAVKFLGDRQVEVLHTPAAYYEALEARLGKLELQRETLQALNILIDRDPWGYLLQAFTRSMHTRRTLFFEVIQRMDARGFGGANIRALYEAKERETPRAA